MGSMLTGQGKMEITDAGANRESNSGRGRFDLLPYEAMEALAIWYEQGCEKYGDRNWENGLSVKDCINRMIRHAVKAGNGWTDEDHLAAVMWNAAAAITMMKRRPDLNDHIFKMVEPKEIILESNICLSAKEGLIVDDNKINNVCNSLNAQCGVSRHIYMSNKDIREEVLESIMYQAQLTIITLQERLKDLEASTNA
jgi:hypothetical protein